VLGEPLSGPVAVVSPHLDDAALGCGRLLASRPGSHVVTVFSGGPARVDPLPDWDRQAGTFAPGDDVMGRRAGEDDAALAVVGASAHRLGLWDEQYREPPLSHARWRPWAVRARQARLDDPRLEDEVVAMLTPLVEALAVGTWVVPLGLWHGDHQKTARACARLARRPPDGPWPARHWVVYEELPYRFDVPDQVGQATAALAGQGFSLQALQAPTGAPGADLDALKAAMVAAYRSQVACLGPDRVGRALAGPERYHLLHPRADRA
jgi:LmbE family N-acetylglucosaminyl deacetylase